MTNAELAELALARRERLARHLARRAPQAGRDLTGVDFTSGPYHNQPLDLATAVEELLRALTMGCLDAERSHAGRLDHQYGTTRVHGNFEGVSYGFCFDGPSDNPVMRELAEAVRANLAHPSQALYAATLGAAARMRSLAPTGPRDRGQPGYREAYEAFKNAQAVVESVEADRNRALAAYVLRDRTRSP